MAEKDVAKEIATLEIKIDKAIELISSGKQTPKQTEAGKLLIALKALDEDAYNKKLTLYKPVSNAYFEVYNNTEEAKAKREKAIEIELNKTLSRLESGGGGSMSDEDVQRPTSARASKPSKPVVAPKVKAPKVPKEPKAQKEKGDRDRTGYNFMGESYGKGPLVLAIIREHVRVNSKITYEALKKVFPDDLLKGYGIFQSYDKAMEISKVHKRFFLKDAQLVRLNGPIKSIAICNQFSSDNILPFLNAARKLGYKID